MAGKTFPAFPAHAQSTSLRICQEAHAESVSMSWRHHVTTDAQWLISDCQLCCIYQMSHLSGISAIVVVLSIHLERNERHFADEISNGFSKKSAVLLKSFIEISLKFLFLMIHLTISQRWSRWWLDADKATSHHLSQWWSNSLTHIYVSPGLNGLMAEDKKTSI